MVRTQAVALISALIILGFVLNLVRLRRLREEYSWLWLLSGFFYLALGMFPTIGNYFAGILGITNPVTAMLFFGMFFIVVILIHYSVKLSRLANHMKDVAQQIAILDGEQTRFNAALENHSNDMSLPAVSPPIEQEDILLEPVKMLKDEVEEFTTNPR